MRKLSHYPHIIAAECCQVLSPKFVATNKRKGLKLSIMAMWISTEEAAERLGVCSETIRNYVRAGKLKAYKIGYRTIRIDPDDLKVFVLGGAN